MADVREREAAEPTADQRLRPSLPELGSTERTRLRRLPARGVAEREQLHAVLDEGLVCHVGFVVDGDPVVLPTAYGRDGDRLYIHGSSGGRLMRLLAGGGPVCVTVTLVDGLVFARSAFHHSMNYRSAVIFGNAETVTDHGERTAALRAFMEHLIPGRWDAVRAPSAKEIAATSVLGLSLEEASVKIRTGPPVDEDADHDLPIWAGVVPLTVVPGAPLDDPRLADGLTAPRHATGWRR